MKILVLTDMFPGEEEPASGVFVYEPVKTLSHKNTVIVVHPRLWNPLCLPCYPLKNNKSTSHYFLNGVEVYRPKLFIPPKGDRLFFRAIFFFLGSILLIKRLQRDFHFDIIHAHMACPAGFAAVLLGRVFRKPVIITAHGSDIHSFPKRFLLRHLVLFALKRATMVTAVSYALKDSIIKMGILKKTVPIIRNGVRHEQFFLMDKTKSRESLNLPMHNKIILFIGNLLPVKGIDSLLNAFAGMGKRNQTDLIIIGKGESEGELKILVKTLRLEPHVSFPGSIKHEEIPLWLNACDVLCLPSHSEGFPTVIIEAFACGRPVVATNVGGIPEAVTDESLGILVPPNNTEALALALRKALEKEWDYQAIAEYGKRFSWDMIADEYLELYKGIVSQKHQ